MRVANKSNDQFKPNDMLIFYYNFTVVFLAFLLS